MNKKLMYTLMFLFLNACFPLTNNSLKKISANDSKEQVIEVLGSPYTKKIYYNKEFLVYYVHDDFFSLFFNSSEFPFVGFYPFLRTGTEYWVILENDKVVSSGTARNYVNNLPKSLSNGGSVVEVIQN